MPLFLFFIVYSVSTFLNCAILAYCAASSRTVRSRLAQLANKRRTRLSTAPASTNYPHNKRSVIFSNVLDSLFRLLVMRRHCSNYANRWRNYGKKKKIITKLFQRVLHFVLFCSRQTFVKKGTFGKVGHVRQRFVLVVRKNDRTLLQR